MDYNTGRCRESEKLNDQFKEQYKTLLHNGNEKNKKQLQEFKETWEEQEEAQLLLTSPTVESGVDYDKRDFSYLKGYIVANPQSS